MCIPPASWRTGVAITWAVREPERKHHSRKASITHALQRLLMKSNESHFYATVWESLFFSSSFLTRVPVSWRARAPVLFCHAQSTLATSLVGLLEKKIIYLIIYVVFFCFLFYLNGVERREIMHTGTYPGRTGWRVHGFPFLLFGKQLDSITSRVLYFFWKAKSQCVYWRVSCIIHCVRSWPIIHKSHMLIFILTLSLLYILMGLDHKRVPIFDNRPGFFWSFFISLKESRRDASTIVARVLTSTPRSPKGGQVPK